MLIALRSVAAASPPALGLKHGGVPVRLRAPQGKAEGGLTERDAQAARIRDLTTALAEARHAADSYRLQLAQRSAPAEELTRDLKRLRVRAGGAAKPPRPQASFLGFPRPSSASTLMILHNTHTHTQAACAHAGRAPPAPIAPMAQADNGRLVALLEAVPEYRALAAEVAAASGVAYVVRGWGRGGLGRGGASRGSGGVQWHGVGHGGSLTVEAWC